MTAKQEKLVLDNMNMVYEIVKPYRSLKNYEDIVSEGVLGLCSAATSFDEIRGNSFSTFAYMHILGKCLNFINRDKIVKPKRTAGKYEKVESITLSPELENTCIHAIEFIDNTTDELVLWESLWHSLSETHYEIAMLLYCGYKRKDIEQLLGINTQQLSSEINIIRQKLIEFGIRSNYGRNSN